MIAFVLTVTVAVGSAAGLLLLALSEAERALGPRLSPGARRRLVMAVAAAIAVVLLTRWSAAGLAVGCLVALWPRVVGGSAAGRRNLARLEALATWTESLRDTAGTAAGLEQAIPATVPGAPPELRRPLMNLTARLDGRIPLPEALAAFADEVDDPAADLVVAALCLNARQRAGGLTRILSALAVTTRQELEMQREVEHERDALRRQAQRIALAVVTFAALQAVFARGWAEPYGTFLGQVALVVVIGIFVAAFVRLRSLAEPAAEPRFLADARRVGSVASYSSPWSMR